MFNRGLLGVHVGVDQVFVEACWALPYGCTELHSARFTMAVVWTQNDRIPHTRTPKQDIPQCSYRKSHIGPAAPLTSRSYRAYCRVDSCFIPGVARVVRVSDRGA